MFYLDVSKAAPVRDVPIDMLKLTVDVHLSTTTKNGCFPNDLRSASPVFKKDNDLREL